MQRKLQFYVSRWKNQFKLHVIQIKPSEQHLNRRNIDPHLLRLLEIMENPDNIYEYVSEYLLRFNQVQQGSRNGQILYDSYHCREEAVTETVVVQSDHNAAYQYQSRSYLLPPSPMALFKLLGVLDSAIHAVVYEAGKANEIVGIEHWQGLPDLTKKEAVCHAALRLNEKGPHQPKQHLSRFIAEWMVDELSSEVETTFTCRHLLETLVAMLQKEPGSLSAAIRQYLYPKPRIKLLLNECCKGADALTTELLDSEVPLQLRTEHLLRFVRNKLGEKPSIQKTEESAEGITKDPKVEMIHAELTIWFAKYSSYLSRIWNKQVETLYGKLADDGGYYHEDYTEIRLLKNASFVMNGRGLMELHFLATNSYHRHYKNNPDQEILEKELRMACADLDLHFLPKQDFHKYPPEFDLPSTNRLQLDGYHFTERTAKGLLRNDLLRRQFLFPPLSGSTHPLHSTSMNRDMRELILYWIKRVYYNAHTAPIPNEVPAKEQGLILQWK